MTTVPSMVEYPVQFEVAYPEGENRFMILLRCLFAIPHYIVLWLISLPLAIGGTIALTLISRALSPVVGPWTLLLAFFPIYAFIILAMGRLPEWLYRYLVGLTRWQYNINTYVLFHNAYPPFTLGGRGVFAALVRRRGAGRAESLATLRQVVCRHPTLHRPARPLHRGFLRVRIRVVCSTPDRALPARRLRLPDWRCPVERPCDGLRAAARRRVSAVLAGAHESSRWGPSRTICRER